MISRLQSILTVSAIALTVALTGCEHSRDYAGTPGFPGDTGGGDTGGGDTGGGDTGGGDTGGGDTGGGNTGGGDTGGGDTGGGDTGGGDTGGGDTGGGDTGGGDTGGGDTGGLPEGSVVANGAGDTAAKAISEGKTLEASTATGSVSVAVRNGTASLGQRTPFSVKKNDVGGMDMTVNGETISFSAADKSDSAGWVKDGGSAPYKELFARTVNDTDKVLDGSDGSYVQVWEYFNETPAGVDTGFGVVGAETPGDVVKGQANATYRGGAMVRARLEADAAERTDVRGDLTLNADFAAGSVSGAVNNLEARARGAATGGSWGSWGATAGSIVMGPAAISGNGFTGGSLSVDANGSGLLGGNINGSTYDGRFYGPDAEQVGGVMSIKGSSEGENFVGSGFFVGGKQ